MTQTSRPLLMAVLMASMLLAGCAGSGGPLAEESGTHEIEAGAAQSHALEVTDQVRLDYTAGVAQGPNIDVFVMDDPNFQAYQSGEEFQFLPCSQQDTGSAQGSCILQGDTFHLVFDNTDAGQARPADVSTASQTVTVDFSFTVESA